VQVLDWQVESRLRQLEGKLLGSESAQPRGKAEPQKYDAGRQGASGALPTAPKAYNADADVVMEPAKPEKKVSNALVVFCSCVVLCCVVLSTPAMLVHQNDMHADLLKSLDPIPVLRSPAKQLCCCTAAETLWTTMFYLMGWCVSMTPAEIYVKPCMGMMLRLMHSLLCASALQHLHLLNTLQHSELQYAQAALQLHFSKQCSCSRDVLTKAIVVLLPLAHLTVCSCGGCTCRARRGLQSQKPMARQSLSRRRRKRRSQRLQAMQTPWQRRRTLWQRLLHQICLFRRRLMVLRP